MAFSPGQSGNPGGRPKSAKLFRDALLIELKRVDGDVERIQKVAEKLVLNALAGDTTAIKEIADRIDGKVPQAVVGDEENPISLIHRIERVIVDSSANPDSAGIPPAPEAG